MESVKDIVDTLNKVNNEGTDSPYWLLIDPSAVTGYLVYSKEEDPEGSYTADLDDEETIKRIEKSIPNCVTGPFFSREDAEAYLRARRYAYSEKTYIYCHSGYWSQKYKALCREIGVGK